MSRFVETLWEFEYINVDSILRYKLASFEGGTVYECYLINGEMHRVQCAKLHKRLKLNKKRKREKK